MFSTTMTATLDPTGSGSAVTTLPAARGVVLERMSATGTGAVSPELRVYLNGSMIDASGDANDDVSETGGIPCPAGSQIRAEWSKGSPGGKVQLIVEGSDGVS